MTKIYLVRHCEAEGNRQKLFQGHINTDISEKGALQLTYLAKRFENLHIDKIFASPLTRAYKTALAVAKVKDMEVYTSDDFIEMYCGELDGRTFAYIFETYPELKHAWFEKPQDFEPVGGETMRELFARAKRAIKKVVNDPENEDKTLLFATHGGFLRCLHCALLYDDIERLKEVPWSTNTAVTLLCCDSEDIKIEYFADDSHLPEELRTSVARMLPK